MGRQPAIDVRPHLAADADLHTTCEDLQRDIHLSSALLFHHIRHDHYPSSKRVGNKSEVDHGGFQAPAR